MSKVDPWAESVKPCAKIFLFWFRIKLESCTQFTASNDGKLLIFYEKKRRLPNWIISLTEYPPPTISLISFHFILFEKCLNTYVYLRCTRVKKVVFQAKCEIVEPARDAETAIKFMAGLTASVDLVAEVTNVQDVSGLRVQVSINS